MSQRQICRAMRTVGHRHFRSNWIYFGDVQIATVDVSLADNFPNARKAQPVSRASIPLADRIDEIRAQLEFLQREVAELKPDYEGKNANG